MAAGFWLLAGGRKLAGSRKPAGSYQISIKNTKDMLGIGYEV